MEVTPPIEIIEEVPVEPEKVEEPVVEPMEEPMVEPGATEESLQEVEAAIGPALKPSEYIREVNGAQWVAMTDGLGVSYDLYKL